MLETNVSGSLCIESTSESKEAQTTDDHGVFTLDLANERDVRALSSPYRFRLFETIRRLGQCTISELAECVCTKPVNLYYHLRALEQVQLVLPIGHRSGVARRAPVLYATTYHTIAIAYDGNDSIQQQRLEIMRRHWHREASDAIEHGVRRDINGLSAPDIVNFRWEALTPSDREQVLEHFASVRRILDQSNDLAQLEGSADDHTMVHVGWQLVEVPDQPLPAPRIESRAH